MVVELVEVEMTKVLVGCSSLEHVVDDGQDAVGDGHDSLLSSEADDESVILSREVCVAGSDGRVGRLDEGGAQPRIRLPGPAAPAFARTLVVSRTHACP